MNDKTPVTSITVHADLKLITVWRSDPRMPYGIKHGHYPMTDKHLAWLMLAMPKGTEVACTTHFRKFSMPAPEVQQ